MAKSKQKLTKRFVDACETQRREEIFFDSDLAGFGLRVFRSGHKSYFIQYRAGRRQRKYTLGAHGVLTPDEARQMARQKLSDIARGEDPSASRANYRDAPSVADLAERFDREHIAARLKPSTQAYYRWSLKKVILPALGAMKVGDVSRADMAKLHERHRGTPYSANRAIEIARKMFSLAEIWEWRPEGSNPATRIPKNKEKQCERYLTDAEFKRLVGVLADAEAEGRESPFAIAAFRLFVLTGCRLSEIQKLRWDAITAHHLELPDSKTGPRRVQLTEPMRAVLGSLRRSEGSPFVIEGKMPGSHISDLQKPWRRIRERAGIDDVRIHDLRHTYASRLVSSGEAIVIVKELLGHKDIKSTMRYSHVFDQAQRDAAERAAAAMPSIFGEQKRKPDLRAV